MAGFGWMVGCLIILHQLHLLFSVEWYKRMIAFGELGRILKVLDLHRDLP
jgi:hypothetical protein